MYLGEPNWDAVGATAEALGAIGVIVTLIYLIRQIKQNTAATRSTAGVAYSQASMAIAKVLSSDIETNAQFYAYLDHPEQLLLDARSRAQACVSIYLHAMEQACDLYSEGTLTEEKWQARYRQIVWLAKRPGFMDYWSEHREVYAETFANYVNQAMNETKSRL